MATCEICGNQFDKSFDVIIGGKRHTFDSFECAISAVAPTCTHCSAASLAMEWKWETGCSVAPTTPILPEHRE